MRVESRGRARALQALYAWDMRSGEDLSRVAVRVWDDLAVAPDERKFAGGIVKAYAGAREKLDADLMEVTENWRLERIGARCPLRTAQVVSTAGGSAQGDLHSVRLLQPREPLVVVAHLDAEENVADLVDAGAAGQGIGACRDCGLGFCLHGEPRKAEHSMGPCLRAAVAGATPSQRVSDSRL